MFFFQCFFFQVKCLFSSMRFLSVVFKYGGVMFLRLGMVEFSRMLFFPLLTTRCPGLEACFRGSDKRAGMRGVGGAIYLYRVTFGEV